MKKTLEKIPGYDRLMMPVRLNRAFRAANKFDYPASGMKVIGVTGTNGKTTTCFMIYEMLRSAGLKVGMMTTVASAIGDEITPQVAHMTTPDARILNKRISEMAKANVEYLVLEVTSHALAQYRTFGIPFDVVVLTNVTHEHLDFHKTFTNYINAKRRLFKLANKTRGGKKIGIINAEDPSAELFAGDIANPLTYGVDKGDLRARQVKLLSNGVEYFVKFRGQKLHIKTHLPGDFNVFNSLAAVAVGLSYDLTPEQIEKGIASLESVEGRMNRIDEGQDFDVVIDFAHTPDSFEKLLPVTRKTTAGKLIVVFGSAGGRRDPAKRPIQGEIAGKYADVVILTEEDDRDTDGQKILDQIADGAKKSGKKLKKDLFQIHDRFEAIEFALKQAQKGDTVMLLGKGHEKTIERKSGAIDWDEAKITREILRKMKGEKSTRDD